MGANLTEADLGDADLSRVDLRDADLRGVKWKDIRTIKLANVYGVRNPPDGFLSWALGQGAVAIESDRDWYAKLNEEPAEQ
jgi:uncharacterized protein YjbI with pentapeptide repeats